MDKYSLTISQKERAIWGFVLIPSVDNSKEYQSKVISVLKTIIYLKKASKKSISFESQKVTFKFMFSKEEWDNIPLSMKNDFYPLIEEITLWEYPIEVRTIITEESV